VTAPLDVAAVRADTPGVATAHHLNAAGAALPSWRTLSAVVDHLQAEAQLGGYEAAAAARDQLEAVYAAAARLLGAEPDELALVESATVGWQRAIDALRLRPGDRVVVSRSTYVSCALHLLTLEREHGVTVDVVPAGPDGALDLAALEQALAVPVALLAVAHVPTASGLVEPVAAAGALAAAAGVPYVVDATQSVGQLPVDVGAIGCDLLVTTGRKYLRAPRGTGLLYVRRALLERLRPVAPDVRGAAWTADRDWVLTPSARRFETWEASTALRLGLGAALEQALALGVPAIADRVTGLAAGLRAGLAALDGVVVDDPPASPSGLVTFHLPAHASSDVAAALGRTGVNVVAVPVAHSRWELAARALPAVVRASVHAYNDEADLQALLDGVVQLATTREAA
jgi:selenocysteine lyase/cysteine desulfurase